MTHLKTTKARKGFIYSNVEKVTKFDKKRK